MTRYVSLTQGRVDACPERGCDYGTNYRPGREEIDRKRRSELPPGYYPDTLAALLVRMGLPAPRREHRFHPTRFWRLDLAWPEQMIAVEVDGLVHREQDGTGGRSRHTEVSGYRRDMEKINTATVSGWRVLRVCTFDVSDGTAALIVADAWRALCTPRT